MDATSNNFPGRRLPRKREQTLPGSDPTCIPAVTAHRPRTLVLCFDGTGDQFDHDISNIAAVFSMLKKNNSSQQMCYYQAGIGTYLNHHLTIPGAATMKKTVDQAIALYLSAHVKEGYEFLMQNYIAGDKICLFGFSRGAYTARALAGMLHKVGLLPKDNKQQIPFAWKMYKDTTENGWKLADQFLQAFCTRVTISFIGVFDTVSSVGVIGKGLPFTSSNRSIRHFRHAMALDERRARFKVNHWDWVGVKDGQATNNFNAAGTEDNEDELLDQWAGKSVRRGHERIGEPKWETDVKEVWFAGGHADVGGGNVLNFTPMSLARIPLRWMVKETFKCNTGILWDIDGLKKIGLRIEDVWPDSLTLSVIHEHPVLNLKLGRKRADTLSPSWVESPTNSSPINGEFIPPMPSPPVVEERTQNTTTSTARLTTLHRNKSSPSLASSYHDFPPPPIPPLPVPIRSDKRYRSASVSKTSVERKESIVATSSETGNVKTTLVPQAGGHGRLSVASKITSGIENTLRGKRSRSCSMSRKSKGSSTSPSPTSSFGDESTVAVQSELDLTSPFSQAGGSDESQFQDPDDVDVLSPLYDQLKLAKVWWVLELCPTKGKKQVGAGTGSEMKMEQSGSQSSADEYEPTRGSRAKSFFQWKDHYFINLGRGRVVPHSPQGMLVHKSVKVRMAKVKDYLPRALVPVRAMTENYDGWEEGKGWKVVWVD